MTTPGRLAAARNARYAQRQRAKDAAAFRANQRRQDHRQRRKLIDFLGGECCRCGLRDHRGLKIVQPAGQQLRTHQLYTLMIHEPDIAAAELRIVCATCRQIELFEYSHARHQEPSVEPSMSSPDDQPSVSEDQPSSSSFGGGDRRDGWGCADAGVSFG